MAAKAHVTPANSVAYICSNRLLFTPQVASWLGSKFLHSMSHMKAVLIRPIIVDF